MIDAHLKPPKVNKTWHLEFPKLREGFKLFTSRLHHHWNHKPNP